MQRLVLRLSGARIEDVERESREWHLVCRKCEHARSVWDLGGIRYKARSRGMVVLTRCPACDDLNAHRMLHRPDSPGRSKRSE